MPLIDTSKGLKGLTGLGGLSALPESDRNAWLAANDQRLRSQGITDPVVYEQMADRYFRNDLFKERFASINQDNALFSSLTPEQRDAIYKESIVNELFTNAYSPYTEEHDDFGNPLVDPNKGMGDANEFQKYMAMDVSSKLELLQSDWLTKPQMDSKLKASEEGFKQHIQSQFDNPYIDDTSAGGALALDWFVRPIVEKYDRGTNDAIIEGIYAKDLKKREADAEPEIYQYYNDVISKLTDDEVKAAFVQSITPTDTNVGNGQFKAFFHDDGTVESEVDNFGIDAMRMYLAKEAVLTQKLGPAAAHDALVNYAKEYINENQSTLTYVGLLANDIGISALSYTADKFNSARQLYDVGLDAVKGDVSVWIDNQGNVVDPDMVMSDGTSSYYMSDGKRIDVQQTQMSRADLDLMGKDSEGRQRDAFWNNQFWSDAEQYGTLSWDKQAQYKRLGASPYKVVYKPGDDSDILYESIKMTSFGLADAASTFIPVWGETGGAAMMAAKGVSILAKTGKAVGTGLYYTSKVAKGIQPTVSAAAIGHAYGRGVYGEALAQNMQRLEESTYTQAQQNFVDNYSNDSNFKAQIDSEVEARFQELKKVQSSPESGRVIVNQTLNDEVLKSQAKQQVMQSHVKAEATAIQNSNQYYGAVTEAAESASDAAMTASITDGAKYFFVNNFGYRSFLFKTPAQRAEQAATQFTKGVGESGKRLTFTSALDGHKLGTLGRIAGSQAWGGAWTNFTDEMQSAGGRKMNEDRFSAYLSGLYTGEAGNDTYGAMNAVASYFTGASESLTDANTWKAGLVGATGSLMSFAPNITSMSTTFATKQGRDAWREASFGEKASMLLANGVLNEYYGKVAGERQLKRTVDQVNSILDNYEDFNVINDAVALDLASMDATNEQDQSVLTYLKALKAVSMLHQFEGDHDLARVGQQSSVIQNAMETVDKLANNNISEEEAANYLSEYYAKNPTVAQSEENDSRILNSLSQNAQALQEADKIWQDINEQLNKVEQQRGERINPVVREKILQRQALDQFITDRMDEMEKSISGSSYRSNRSSISNPIESFGTQKARERQVRTYERAQKTIEKEIAKAEKELSEASQAVSDFEEQHRGSQNNLDVLELTTLMSKRTAAELQLQFLNETLDNVKNTADLLRNTGESETVLTKDEILALSPEARARMLNLDNFSDYSKEQQAEITALRKELSIKDLNLLRSVQDMANLERHKRANSNAYYAMASNPEAAAVQLEAEKASAAQKAADLLTRRRAEMVNAYIEKLEGIPNVNPADLRDAIYRNMRVLNPTILDYMAETEANEEGLEALPSYVAEIERAKEWATMVTDISRAISQMGLQENESRAFSQNIDAIISVAATKQEAMQRLQDVTQSQYVNDADKTKFQRLLDLINGVETQRDATKEETAEEKRAREATSEKAADEHNEVVDQAEKQAKAAAEQLKAEQAEDEAAREQLEQAQAQLSEEETPEEREKRKQAEMQEFGLTSDEWEAKEKPQVPTEESLEQGLANADNVELVDSPDLDTQVSEVESAPPAEEEGTTPIITKRDITPDVTDSGNKLADGASELIGNLMYGYDLDALENEAKEVKRTGKDPQDKMSRFFNWMDNAGVKLQDIIDAELSDITKVNPNLEVMYINPQTNATDDAALGDFPLLVVEYNDKVKSVHNEDRGGVVTSNGKQYLIVGSLGFGKGTHGDAYRAMRARHKNPRMDYFKANPTERFFVVPNEHTEVQQQTSGRLIRQGLNDESVEIRSISQLLEDPTRNPKGLSLEDLKWGIQYDQRFATVGVSERNTVYPPRDASSNQGGVFLLMEAANGNYIPASIIPIMMTELKDGALKNQISKLVGELMSPEHEDRLKAVTELSKLLHLDKDKDTILVGTKDKPTVSTSRNGVILRTFNLKDANFNSMDFLNAIAELNPRVNITTSVLANPTLLRMYDEAGALNLDVAKIGTSNSGYTVYDIGPDGGPVKTTPVNNGAPNVDANSDLAKANFKKEHSIVYAGKVYRERDGKWYTNTWQEVTDPRMVEQLYYNSLIRSRDLKPDYTKGQTEYYVLNSDPNNPQVITRNSKTQAINVLSAGESASTSKEINDRKVQEAKAATAKAAQEALEKIEDNMSTETVQQTGEGEEVALTEQDLIEQTMGNFNGTHQEEQTNFQAQEIVDKIVLDTHDIHLSDDGVTYEDATGRKYARVTSVISATDGAERMDPDNPWTIPSTTIGTGVDEFVRDFFANKIGNLDTLQDRYPNATTSQLKAFADQLTQLKKLFADRKLTIVPRDVTVTGTVEVTDKNGKKYKLDVAGTLDLLAYDDKGNFYIFDMKTNRSAPNDKKAAKWGKQLSLYKQFLEEKYHVSVKGTEIIPIEVSYPAPKGWRDAKTEYSSKEGKLYADGVEYRGANPTLHSNIPIPTSPVEVRYDMLTQSELGLLTPVMDGTFDSSTGTERKGSVNKSADDINKTGDKSLAELQQRGTSTTTDATTIIKDRNYSQRLRAILKEKGFTGKPSEVTSFLEGLGMPTTNITDVEAWLDMLQNCK